MSISMSTSTNTELIKSGYMFKRGKVVKSWKNRFFKLYINGSLQYYTYSDSSTPNGIIHLSNAVKISKKESNEIQIVTLKRIWNLKTKTQLTRNRWFDSIFMIFERISFNDIPKQILFNKAKHISQKHKRNSQTLIKFNYNNISQKINTQNRIQLQKPSISKQQTIDIEDSKDEPDFVVVSIVDKQIIDINQQTQPFISHKVKQGDTLVALSLKYSVSVHKIKSYNKSICFSKNLGHIAGKQILIPNKTNIKMICDENEKQMKNKNEPDENEKYYKRKAFRYLAKNVTHTQCDYYLQNTKWNVRKAVVLWKMDLIWDKTKGNTYENKLKSDIEMEESVSLLHMGSISHERSISSYFDHIEFDDDGYFRYNLTHNDINKSVKNSVLDIDRERSMSDSMINNEFIMFRFQQMRDSIEEFINMDKEAEEYEQRQMYEEMMKNEEIIETKSVEQRCNELDEEYGMKYELMCQQYQMQAMEKSNDSEFVQLLQQQLDGDAKKLGEWYMGQRDMLLNEQVVKREIFDEGDECLQGNT
eukprot:299004_1